MINEEPTQAQIDFAEKLAEEYDIDLSEIPFTKQDYADYIHETLEPIDHNYSYTFTNNVYDPVEFKVTKINKTYGFTRQDTGECCNFTIVKDKARGGFTFKLQPLDYFNLPEWVGG